MQQTTQNNLLQWCQTRTQKYKELKITDLTTKSWKDGLGFCALIHSYFPMDFDYDLMLSKNREERFSTAIELINKYCHFETNLQLNLFLSEDEQDFSSFLLILYLQLQKYEMKQTVVKQLEEWTYANFSKIIFDSDIHDWSENTSEFDENVFKKSHLVFLVEDTEGNVFGCYTEKVINQYVVRINGIPTFTTIHDENAFVFTINSNERFKEMKKYDIRETETQWGVALFKQDDDKLFGIGRGFDILVMKNNSKDKCFSIQNSFDYENDKRVLTGKVGEFNNWEVKRVRVIQMEETADSNERKRIDKERIKKEKELKKKRELEELYEKQNNMLKQLNEYYKEMDQETIKIYEELTGLQYEGIIFDSNIHKCATGDSQFHQILYEKEKIIVLIEDVQVKNTFGIFIDAKIDNIMKARGNNISGKGINDPNCFIFSLDSDGRSDEILKFKPKDKKGTEIFRVFDEQGMVMFLVGDVDVFMFKCDNWVRSYCDQESFDYQGHEDILVGHCGMRSPHTVGRVSVIQMRETEEQKRIRKEKEEQERLERQRLMEETKNNLQTIWKDEIKQIEEWTELDCLELIFDSNVNSWEIGNCELNNILLGRSNVVLIIEDTNGNRFGAYFNSTIDSEISFSAFGMNGKTIMDSNAFVFSLKSNGRLDKPMKFNITEEKSIMAMFLFKESFDAVLSIGEVSDIVIQKQQNKTECSCNQKCFDYNGIENALIGKTDEKNHFEMKQFIALQFGISEERKRLVEMKMLEKIHQELIEKHSDEINQLQQWTNKTFKSVIFDSTVHSWEMNNSVFSQKVYGKEHVVFIVEEKFGNKFGLYFNGLISQIASKDGNTINGALADPDAFLFTLKANGKEEGMKKFDLPPDLERFLLMVMDDENFALMIWGNIEIAIFKKPNANASNFMPKTPYSQTVGNELGYVNDDNYFIPSRIIALQFE